MTTRGMPSDHELELLLRLADGSLPPGWRAAAARLVAHGDYGHELVRRHGKAVARVRGVPVRAPESLRRRVAESAERRPTRPTLARVWLAPAVATAVAVVAIVLLTARDPAGGTTVIEAAALGGRESVEPPPPAPPAGATVLDVRHAGVPFPNWETELDWIATGGRSDELEGRRARTVFYEHGGQRVAYTIVSGRPLDMPRGAVRTVQHGLVMRGYRRGEQQFVVVLRGGRTCVLSGDVADASILLKLAAWRPAA